MKRINTIYWILTGLFALLMMASAIPNIMSMESGVTIFKQMGYPAYLLPFLGVAKALGSIAILIPGYPRLKEWAYAGLIYDLTGAAYSFIRLGTPLSGWLPILVFIIIGFASYIYYHKRKAYQDKSPV